MTGMQIDQSGNGDNRRTNGRLAVEGVRTTHGVVLDASAGGLRIRGAVPRGSRPGSRLEIALLDDAGRPAMSVTCEIRWIQKHPFRGATFGVAFVGVGEEQRRLLFATIRAASVETRCTWQRAG